MIFRLFVEDNVKGYSFLSMQKAADYRKLEDVRDYLKDNYSNSTKGNLNKLFDFYIDIKNSHKK